MGLNNPTSKLQVEGAVLSGEAFSSRPLVIAGLYGGSNVTPVGILYGQLMTRTTISGTPNVEVIGTAQVELTNTPNVNIVGGSLGQDHPEFMRTNEVYFSRPANTTTYDVGDLVANSTTAGSVQALTISVYSPGAGKAYKLVAVELWKTTAGLTNATFRLHFYTEANPVVANGDNGVFRGPSFGYYGSVDVTMDRTIGTAGAIFAWGRTNLLPELYFPHSSGSLYCLVEARGAYTPGSGELFLLLCHLAKS